MAKFYGKVGYAEQQKTGPGIWGNVIVEKSYYGDVLRNTRRLDTDPDKLNDDIRVTNTISVVADAYAMEHFFNIRYVVWQGVKWKVTDVEVAHPRLQFRLGEIYNEQTVRAPIAP